MESRSWRARSTAGRAAAERAATSRPRWTTTSCSEPEGSSRRDLLLSLIPAILLCVIAAAQVCLTRVEGLTPWKGGGFGMFSTNDDGLGRPLGIRVSGPEGAREIPLPSSLAIEAYHASILPSGRRLRRLAHGIAALERDGEPGSSPLVHVAIWRLEYDPRTLAPRPEVVRELVLAAGR